MLTKELLKAKQTLKQKYLALKFDLALTQNQLEKQLKNISQPLKQILQQVTQPRGEQIIKQECNSFIVNTSSTLKNIDQKTSLSTMNMYHKLVF